MKIYKNMSAFLMFVLALVSFLPSVSAGNGEKITVTGSICYEKQDSEEQADAIAKVVSNAKLKAVSSLNMFKTEAVFSSDPMLTAKVIKIIAAKYLENMEETPNALGNTICADVIADVSKANVSKAVNDIKNSGYTKKTPALNGEKNRQLSIAVVPKVQWNGKNSKMLVQALVVPFINNANFVFSDTLEDADIIITGKVGRFQMRGVQKKGNLPYHRVTVTVSVTATDKGAETITETVKDTVDLEGRAYNPKKVEVINQKLISMAAETIASRLSMDMEKGFFKKEVEKNITTEISERLSLDKGKKAPKKDPNMYGPYMHGP